MPLPVPWGLPRLFPRRREKMQGSGRQGARQSMAQETYKKERVEKRDRDRETARARKRKKAKD